MKKHISVFLMLSLFAMNTIAQKNAVKLGTITFGGTNYGVQYERWLSSHFSLVFQYGLAANFNHDVQGEGNLSQAILFGDGFYAEGRYYLTTDKDLLEGWHFGVNFNYINTTIDDGFEKNYLERFGFGPVLGYQWVFASHITLDTMFGGGWMDTSTSLSDYRKGFFPLIGINLGYNF